MELWIRSQNKRELRPNPKLGLDELKNEYYIVDRYDFERAIILGKYKTEKRALEVLNEIELALGCKRTAFNNTIVFVNVLENVNSMVYEMPEE